MPAKLLTATETAQILNVKEERVYQMVRSGIIPVVRLGRQIRFDKEQLERWIAAGGQAFPGGWRKDAMAN